MTPGERVLAIDHGERRVGLAVSDPSYGFVRGLPTIDRREIKTSLLKAIAQIVNDEAIDRIVIGIPITLDGTEGPAAREVRSFADDLAQRIAVPELQLPVHDSRPREFESADEDVSDEVPRAFLENVLEIRALPVLVRRRPPLEAGFEEAFVEVKRE